MGVTTLTVGTAAATESLAIAVRVLSRNIPTLLGNLLHGKDVDGVRLEAVDTNKTVRLDMDVNSNLTGSRRSGELEGDHLGINQIGYLDGLGDNGSVGDIGEDNPPVRPLNLMQANN